VISGATSSTYVLVADDVGETITVRQTETAAAALYDTVFGTSSATSAPTAVVANAYVIESGDHYLMETGDILLTE
jgi:hypothetical protein